MFKNCYFEIIQRAIHVYTYLKKGRDTVIPRLNKVTDFLLNIYMFFSV